MESRPLQMSDTKSDDTSLQDQVNTRENSTLVFATIAASASLVILAVVLQSPSIPPSVRSVGFLFSLLGPIYREITIFKFDIADYNRLTDHKTRYSPNAILARMVTVRYFLFLPIVAWLSIDGRPVWFLLLNVAVLTTAWVLSREELTSQRQKNIVN